MEKEGFWGCIFSKSSVLLLVSPNLPTLDLMLQYSNIHLNSVMNHKINRCLIFFIFWLQMFVKPCCKGHL